MPRSAVPTLYTADRDAILAHLRAADPKLAVVIDRVGHCDIRNMRGFSIYESLLRSIVYQQLAGKAAATILARVQRLYAPDIEDVAKLPYPTPQQILSTPPELLRSAGLSQNKMLAVKDLAAKTLDGTVPSLQRARFLSDDELIQRLTTIRGIGQWTVEMMLMFRLGRLDVLPVSDYGVRKGFQLTYNMRALPRADQMHRRANKWKPYRSIAAWMMWRVLEFKD